MALRAKAGSTSNCLLLQVAPRSHSVFAFAAGGRLFTASGSGQGIYSRTGCVGEHQPGYACYGKDVVSAVHLTLFAKFRVQVILGVGSLRTSHVGDRRCSDQGQTGKYLSSRTHGEGLPCIILVI